LEVVRVPGEVDLEMCGRHDEAIRRLDGWQTRQNGALLRLETKLDNLKFWLITLLTTVVVQLALTLFKGVTQ